MAPTAHLSIRDPAAIIAQAMALGPGARLDVYEIVGPLGVGGMGEVWLARDTNLGRQVALKLLPVELSGDATRVARFQQEARLASSLNHPSICIIHAPATPERTTVTTAKTGCN